MASLKRFSALGGIPPTDPQFNLTTLLLHGDGTNGAQNNTFVDSSSNNFTITRNGNTTQGTFTPFSQTGWSNSFNADSVLSFTQPALGTVYTIELWAFIPEAVSADYFYVAATNAPLIGYNGATFAVARQGSFRITSSTNPTVGAWNHIAVVREGLGAGQFKLYLNGILTGTGDDSSTIGSQTARIGGDASAGNIRARISNLRIVNNTAVYTTNFTPPTTPLTAITNTVLLTCQSNRFIDNSSNNLTFTPSGPASVQAFSPFAPTDPYSTSVVGGSGYFDGNGDFLQGTVFSPELSFGTGDFTIEFWVYPQSTARQDWVDLSASSGFNRIIVAYISSAIAYHAGSGSAASARITGPTIAVSQWYHIALSRNSGSSRLFVNGAQVGSTFADTLNFTSDLRLTVFRDPAGSTHATGNISDLRILKGTGLYTANFTPPTAPLTAITNASLLLNFTNGGIIDNAAKVNLETVGNAQISTSVKQFGTGSLAFDGTGDWLTFADRPTTRLGSGDFTLEGWVYLNAVGVAYGLISKGTATTGWSVNITSGDKLQFSYTASNLTGATSLAANTWYYFAVVRSGTATGNLKVYLDGVVDATSGGAVTDNFNQTSIGYVGADRVAGSALNGYLDDVRITLAARTITTPTSAFPDQ
jgi:hypothetical protein